MAISALPAPTPAGVVAEIDARQVAKRELGWASTADWYTHLAGLRRGDGKRRVDHARQLVRDRPATLAALREGTVSPEQAAVVLDAVDALPTSPTSATAPNWCCWRKPAGSTPPTWPAPDGAWSTSSTPTPPTASSNGCWTGRNAPPTTPVPVHHRRRRRRRPTQGPRQRRGRRDPPGRPPPAHRTRPATTTTTTGELVHDPRDAGARMWDALRRRRPARVGHRPATRRPTAPHPPHRHHHPRHAAHRRSGPATTDDGARPHVGRHPAARLRRRDHPRRPRHHGEVLDVGRATLVTAAIWVALVLRDQHCAFPGCDRPPLMCHAHHIQPLADGGTTSLDNLVLLCGHHHRPSTTHPGRVRLSPTDRKPEFLPPPKPGHPRDWIRHRPRRE